MENERNFLAAYLSRLFFGYDLNLFSGIEFRSNIKNVFQHSGEVEELNDFAVACLT